MKNEDSKTTPADSDNSGPGKSCGSADELEEIGLSDEDLRAALREMKTYVDVTERDLRKIFILSIRHARQRLIVDVPVRNIMKKDAVTIGKDLCIGEIVRLFSEHDISFLPVTDSEKRVIGVVSESDVLSVTGMKREHSVRDIIRHLLGEPLPERASGSTAEAIMSSPAITVNAASTIRSAAEIFSDRNIRRLPVVDSEGKIEGIISRGDIVRVIGEKWRATSEK